MSAKDARKKAKADPDTMQVDSSGETATLVSLKPSVLEGVTDREIMMRLRPVVLKLESYADTDTVSICADLAEIKFLQLSSSIQMGRVEDILGSLSAIYMGARKREAGKVPTDGNGVEPRHVVAAIEIRNAVLHSRLVQIGETEMKIYQYRVPDLQNPGNLTSVIIRPEDEGFWNRCIELSLEGHKVCGVGNPGIGKTTTTLYLLQQLIKNQKEPVVYTIRNQNGLPDIFYEFVPVVENEEVEDVTVTVYSIWNHEKKARIPSLKRQGVFYVVDPGDYDGSCDDTSQLHDARFIMGASNDRKHWGGSNFTKYRGSDEISHLQEFGPPAKAGVLVYGYLWTGSQLLAVKPYFNKLKNLSDDEIMRRFRIVGGSFRDITFFDEINFNSTVKTALNLDPNAVQELAEGRHQFAFDNTAPSSALVGVSPSDQRLTICQITLKSDYVEELLAMKYLRMSWYQVLGEDNGGNRGNLFESYLRLKFSTGPVHFTINQVRESKREKPLNARNNEKKNYQPVAGGITLGAKRSIVRVSNMNEHVRTDQAGQFMVYSKNESEPLIDMIFRLKNGYDAVQATISEKHGAAAEKIRALKDELNLKEGEKLRIFFAVPLSRYRDFETSPVNPLLDQGDLSEVSIYHVGVTADE